MREENVRELIYALSIMLGLFCLGLLSVKQSKITLVPEEVSGEEIYRRIKEVIHKGRWIR